MFPSASLKFNKKHSQQWLSSKMCVYLQDCTLDSHSIPANEMRSSTVTVMDPIIRTSLIESTICESYSCCIIKIYHIIISISLHKQQCTVYTRTKALCSFESFLQREDLWRSLQIPPCWARKRERWRKKTPRRWDPPTQDPEYGRSWSTRRLTGGGEIWERNVKKYDACWSLNGQKRLLWYSGPICSKSIWISAIVLDQIFKKMGSSNVLIWTKPSKFRTCWSTLNILNNCTLVSR